MDGGSPIIRNNVFGPNPPGFYLPEAPISGGIGVAIQSGSPQITGNTITGCGQGILSMSPPTPTTVLEGNTFQGNIIDIEHRY